MRMTKIKIGDLLPSAHSYIIRGETLYALNNTKINTYITEGGRRIQREWDFDIDLIDSVVEDKRLKIPKTIRLKSLRNLCHVFRILYTYLRFLYFFDENIISKSWNPENISHVLSCSKRQAYDYFRTLTFLFGVLEYIKEDSEI